MKKIIFLASILHAFILPLYPQSAGNTGLSFLKFGFGAKNIAMGDAGTSGSEDVTSLFYNPAKLALTEGTEFMFMHNAWIQDISSELIGVKFDFLGLPFGIGFNVTSVGDIEVHSRAVPEPESTFDANYFFGSLSTGFRITDFISAGVTVKYLYEGVLADESTGLGFDIGVNYATPVEGLSASAAVRNLGSMNKLREEETKLPSEFRIGPAYNSVLSDSKFEISAAAEVQKYFDVENIHLNFGVEILYNKLIALRGGYQSGYEAKSFTGGLGLRWGNLSFDYALSPFQLGLGSGHSISLNFSF
jgi:hypothetical protein